MKSDWLWAAAFIIMLLLGVAVAFATHNYVNALLNPAQFSYQGNNYMENQYELSTDMEHKTNSTYLYDFSGHSPSRDLKIPDSLASVTGKYGLAYRWAFPRDLPINGTDTGILLESFTIEAWLNPQSVDQIICWTGITNSGSRRLLLATNGSLWAQMTYPALDFFSNAALGAGSWTHVAFVYDSDVGTISWIINGTMDKTSGPGYTSDWHGPFKIGGWTDSLAYVWNGKIDEFRIKHGALNVAQVAADMNGPIQKAVITTGLNPNTDLAILNVKDEIPQEVPVDAHGNAAFDTFAYGDFFTGYFTIIHNGQTSQSNSLSLRTGDEYHFSPTTSYLSPNIVFGLIVAVFPLATAVAYIVKRVVSKKLLNLNCDRGPSFFW
jgi:hypothetical protein